MLLPELAEVTVLPELPTRTAKFRRVIMRNPLRKASHGADMSLLDEEIPPSIAKALPAVSQQEDDFGSWEVPPNATSTPQCSSEGAEATGDIFGRNELGPGLLDCKLKQQETSFNSYDESHTIMSRVTESNTAVNESLLTTQTIWGPPQFGQSSNISQFDSMCQSPADSWQLRLGQYSDFKSPQGSAEMASGAETCNIWAPKASVVSIQMHENPWASAD
ncbi:hypothetical protein MMC10_000345 [Thelotrema lepadinum]|nr:hypothetical protein [Thelotrema lepadinum]